MTIYVRKPISDETRARVDVPPCKVCGESRTWKRYPPAFQKRDAQVCRRCSKAKGFLCEELRARLSVAAKKYFLQPGVREANATQLKVVRLKNLADPTVSAKLSEAMKRRWVDPVYKEKMGAKLRQQQYNPVFRENQFRAQSLWFIPKAVREKLSPNEVSLLGLPEVRKEIIAATAAALNLEVPK